MSIRTFLALDIDDAILDRMQHVQEQLAISHGKINWVSRENLHLTLVYLGEVVDELIPDVCGIMEEVASEIEPFAVEIHGIRCVPDHGQPRMFWAVVQDSTGRLAILQNRLATALYGLGLRQEERGYKPHITLARVKYAADPAWLRRSAEQFANEDLGLQHADEVVAYGSELARDGPVYTALARAPVGQ